MTDIPTIAKGLTKAQRETMLSDPDALTWHNEEGLVFTNPPLIDTEEHSDGYDMWFTETGLSVRAYLMENENG